MGTSDREQDLLALRRRQATIAEAWYQAIGHSSYVPLPAQQVRARLAELTDELISLFLAPSLDRETGEKVGVALAELHLVQAETLGGTLEVLGRELIGGLPEETRARRQADLAAMLGAVATGFFRQASRTILAEQEETRTALVTELRATDRQLRQARDQLEVRVQERTTELARVNEGLRAEIAERQRAEEALQESEERWRSLVDNAPDMVATVDRTGRILYLNRVPGTSAVTAEAVVGSDALSYALPEHRPALREAIAAAFAGQGGSYLELVALGPSGHSAWHALRIGPVLRDGQVASVMLVARDISEQREVQELKDNLIRDVSHELRAPLAKVRMSLNVLEELLQADQVDRERATRIGQLAARNVDRLLQTVEGFLDLTRLESGVWSNRGQSIELEELVAEAVQYMLPLAGSKNIRLESRLPEQKLPIVTGDRERLFRVLLNLLDNAIKFTAEGQVLVVAQARGMVAEVAVSDTGQGIEPQVLVRIFERFYQEKTQAEGVGLGLTICKAVVEAHGGEIWAESPGRGQGATFRFTLPLEPQGSAA